jgi:hypothetical protein
MGFAAMLAEGIKPHLFIRYQQRFQLDVLQFSF